MSKPIVTKQMLIDADACGDQVDLFEKTFGDSVSVTIKRAEEVAVLFDWGWATCLLDAQGRDEYQRAKAAAWAEYLRVMAAAQDELDLAKEAALDEYLRVEAAALAEYRRVGAPAWATAFINMHKRGERAWVRVFSPIYQ